MPRFSIAVRSRMVSVDNDERCQLADGDSASGQGNIPHPAETQPGGRIKNFDARETVFAEGDLALNVYQVLDGVLMLFKALPDGRRQIVELLGPGDVLGYSVSGCHDASAEMLRASRLLAYPKRIFDASPALQLRMAKRMTIQLCSMHDHALLLGRKTAKERVASFLMQLIPGRGDVDFIGRTEDAGDQATITVALTRQEIADYLGLTVETVSRAFTQLRREGRIGYSKAIIITVEVCKLARNTGSD